MSLLTISLLLLLATSIASGTQVTVVDFAPSVAVSPVDFLVIVDFNGLVSDSATFFDITLSSTTPYNFWTVGGFTFKIIGITENVYTVGGIT